LLALNAMLKKNTPHAPVTASYFDSVERDMASGNEAFKQRTGVDVLAAIRREWQEKQKDRQELISSVTPPPRGNPRGRARRIWRAQSLPD
jgi:hypothetical protein